MMNRHELIQITNDMMAKGLEFSARLIWRHDLEQREALARVEVDNRQLQLIVNSHANMRDTAQREALYRVAVDRDEYRRMACENFEILTQHRKRADTAQAQLAEAMGLLERLVSSRSYVGLEAVMVDVDAFLAQAEQQEAESPMSKMAEGLRQKAADEWANHPSNPANQEAQGAQAGDDYFASPEEYAAKRAALATQPTEFDSIVSALEVMEGFTGEDWSEMFERFPALAEQFEGYAARKVAESSGACQPAVPVAEHPVVKALLEVAAAAHLALEGTDSDGVDSTWDEADRVSLEAAIEVLDRLPDDQPGYVMEPAAKAAWALRKLTAVRGAK